MHLTACMSLFGSTIAMACLMLTRRWLLGSIWAFCAAYTLFDKFYPRLLPQPLVDSFAVITFLLAMCALAKVIVTRRERHN